MPEQGDKYVHHRLCKEAREQCAARWQDLRQAIQERNKLIEELFAAKISALTEQVETALANIQGALSLGSEKMTDMDNRITSLSTQVAALSQQIEDIPEIKSPQNKTKMLLTVLGIVLPVILIAGGTLIHLYRDVAVLHEQVSVIQHIEKEKTR